MAIAHMVGLWFFSSDAAIRKYFLESKRFFPGWHHSGAGEKAEIPDVLRRLTGGWIPLMAYISPMALQGWFRPPALRMP
jgi:hypothetical protein